MSAGVPSADPVLIAGDGIAPALAATTLLPHLLSGGSMPLDGRMCAVYVHELDEEAIRANMLARGCGFEERPRDEQRRLVHVRWRYGNGSRPRHRRVACPWCQRAPLSRGPNAFKRQLSEPAGKVNNRRPDTGFPTWPLSRRQAHSVCNGRAGHSFV